MKFGTIILDKKAERRIYQHILFPSCLKIAAVLWVFFAVTVKRLDQFTRNSDSQDIFSDRASCFDMSVQHDCLSKDYGHTSLPIVLKFGTIVGLIGTKAEQNICKDLIFPFRLKIAAILWAFFAVTGIERGLLFITTVISFLNSYL